jgi:cobyrinic acid a,c-diamide synthase
MMLHDPDVQIAAVILNRAGSDKHRRMIESAWADLPPIIGAVPRSGQLSHPSRHLGLVQADERADLIDWLDALADTAEAHIDLSALPFAPLGKAPHATSKTIRPPAQRIAIAQDEAFRFAYPHMLQEWRAAGAQITPFSPLRDDVVPQADFVFLPGGYPELYAGKLAANSAFIGSLKNAAQMPHIYGECGGYMLLGAGLIDADGTRHQMAGLLDLETSFQHRKLHLGYRSLTPLAPKTTSLFAGRSTASLPAHEFHYATTLRAHGTPLFGAKDSEGTSLSHMGLIEGRVCGSFAHIIEFNT